MSKTSPTRRTDTAARGTIINTIDSNKNEIITCIAYSKNAIILPICKLPLLIKCAPNHTIATLEKFITKVIIGSSNIIKRFTNKFILFNSTLASWNFFCSIFSLWNARITFSPTKFSRATKLSLSTRVCNFLNLGTAIVNSVAITASKINTAKAIIQLRSGALFMAFCRPPIAIIGAINASLSSIIDVV